MLFVRNIRSHSCDPRDIMFEMNKALVHARADVTVRLISLRCTEKFVRLGARKRVRG